MPLDRITLHNVFDEERKDALCKPFTFPGGEPHVHFNPELVEGKAVWIDARLATADGFMQMLATLDAVKACNPARLGLFIPYFPGARQDRRQKGTPFTLRLYVEAIGRINPDLVVVLDPHSHVLAALMEHEMIEMETIAIHDVLPPHTWAGLICPDAGAEKRVHEVAKALNISNIVFARKYRDTKTGQLSGFGIEPLDEPGLYLMVDDICDGGGTFIGLATAIEKNENADYCLDLWVSHGIFSKGLQYLLEHFTNIYTTDSFPICDEVAACERLRVTPLHDKAAAIMRRRIST